MAVKLAPIPIPSFADETVTQSLLNQRLCRMMMVCPDPYRTRIRGIFNL